MAGQVYNIAQGLQSIIDNMPDNTQRLITEAIMRDQNSNLWLSALNRIDDAALLNLRDFSDRAYVTGEYCGYDDGSGYKIYRANKAIAGAPFAPADWDLVAGVETATNNDTSLQSSAILSGSVVSINVDTTKWDLAAGKAIIVDNTDLTNIQKYVIEWTAQGALILSNLLTDVRTNVALSVNNTPRANVTFGNSFSATVNGASQTVYIAEKSVGDWSTEERRIYAPIARLVHSTSTTIFNAVNLQQNGTSVLSSLVDYLSLEAPKNVEGNEFSGKAGVVQVAKTAGKGFRFGSNYDTNTNDPNVQDIPAADPTSHFYRYQDGVGGFSQTAITTALDPDNYDDGSGVLQSVANNRWTLQPVWVFAGSGTMFVQYGQEQFSSKDAAIAAIATANPVLDQNLVTDAVFRGYFVVIEGATDLSLSTQFEWRPPLGDIGGGQGTTVVTDLQTAYNASIDPEIVTDVTRGALTAKEGTADDTQNVIEVQNNAGTVTARITGEGNVLSNNVKKANYSAVTAPTATDDSAAGYEVGSVWIDTATDTVYTCVDATATAAVWSTEHPQPTNGLQNIGSDIGLGGTLTQSTSIAGDTNGLNIGTVASRLGGTNLHTSSGLFGTNTGVGAFDGYIDFSTNAGSDGNAFVDFKALPKALNDRGTMAFGAGSNVSGTYFGALPYEVGKGEIQFRAFEGNAVSNNATVLNVYGDSTLTGTFGEFGIFNDLFGTRTLLQGFEITPTQFTFIDDKSNLGLAYSAATDYSNVIWNNATYDNSILPMRPLINNIIGVGATWLDSDNVVFGNAANASGADSISIGNNSDTTAADAIAIGRLAEGLAIGSVSLGYNAANTTGVFNPYSVSIGYLANQGTADIGNASIAIGYASETIGGNAVAIGNSAIASNSNNISVGVSSNSSGERAIAIGNSTIASGNDSLAIGDDAEATNIWNLSIGEATGKTTGTVGNAAISIGPFANNGTSDIGAQSLALGYQADSTAANAMAMGTATLASANYAKAFGLNTEATAQGAMMFGHNSTGTKMINSTADSVAFGWSVSAGGEDPSFIFAKTADSYMNGTGAITVHGTTATNSSVGLDLQSTTRVFKTNVVDNTEEGALTATAGMIVQNSTDNVLKYYNGTEWVKVEKPELQKTFILDDPIATDDYLIMELSKAVTITKVTHEVFGATSVDFNINHSGGTDLWAADKTADGTKTSETVFTDATCTAAQIRYQASAISGTPTKIEITITYTED
jgi:hypothetical protein